MENSRENGAALLNEVKRQFERFLVVPKGASVAAALWCVLAHACRHGLFTVVPVLTIHSALKSSGKSQFQRILRYLVPNPFCSTNPSGAALFRALDQMRTLVLDEVDAWLPGNELMRSVIDASHVRGDGGVARAAGDGILEYQVHGAICLAMIGEPDPTIISRSLMTPMRRRVRDEPIERMRLDRLPGELLPLNERLGKWVEAAADELRNSDPADVDGLDSDRAQDNWRALLAIAEVAGGEWPSLAREAAVLISARAEEEEEAFKALRDLRRVFEEYSPKDKLESSLISSWMNSSNPDEWGNFMTQQRLAKLLRPFGISSGDIWTVEKGTPEGIRKRSLKGYKLEECVDAFRAYLP